MDQAKATVDSATNTTSSAADQAKQTIEEAATKATSTSSALNPMDSCSTGQPNPGGAPGQEPVSGEQGKSSKGEPFDKGNVNA